MNNDKKKAEFVPETPEWAEKEEEPKKNWNLPFGVGTTPCAKSTIMNSIGASFVAGVAYNLATSRSPIWIVPVVCLTTHTVSWFHCRYNYWKSK